MRFVGSRIVEDLLRDGDSADQRNQEKRNDEGPEKTTDVNPGRTHVASLVMVHFPPDDGIPRTSLDDDS